MYSQNLVPNGSFEADTNTDGFPDSWGKRVWTERESNPQYVRSGSYSLRLSEVTDPNWNYCRNSSVPSLKENTQYILRAFVKTENMGANSWVRMRLASNPYPPAGYPATNSVTDPNADWEEIYVAFTTVANNGNLIPGPLDIMAQIYSGTAWIDDVELIEVAPYKIVLQSSAQTLLADGRSFASITAKIYDAYDNFLNTATNPVTFSLTGTGSLVGNTTVNASNGIATIIFQAGTDAGSANITATSPGLVSSSVSIEVTTFGWDGVPHFALDYTKDIEEYWAQHPFNSESDQYKPNILSPEPVISVADYGGDIQAAINALPVQGGTLFFPSGSYYVPTTGIKIEQRSNIHFISDGEAIIKAPAGFLGVSNGAGNENSLTMFQFQAVPGDWLDDNYANNTALANPIRNFYFRNIVFNPEGNAESSLLFWAVEDVVFDNCSFYGATGENEMHIGAWSNNFWARGCSFSGTAGNAFVWDGTHGSGVLNCTFANTISGSTQIVFLSNDDCTRDVITNGVWDAEEIRLGNFIVVKGCEFGGTSPGKMPIAASARNILIKNNSMHSGAYRFYGIGPRCTQMTHNPPMPAFEYLFYDNRIIGNTVNGDVTQFVNIASAPNNDCTPSEYTSDNGINGSKTGYYEVRGNTVSGNAALGYVCETPAPGNPITGTNIVCGNCFNDPSCTPVPFRDCIVPIPTLDELGCYTNTGVTYYLDGTNGDDGNLGTIDQPWRTFRHAVEHFGGGSTLIIKGGIYELPDDTELMINASGVSETQATIIKAETNERVLITGIDLGSGFHKAPNIRIKGDFYRMQGIFFGGNWGSGNEFSVYGGGRVDNGREFIGCTFFGFNSIRGGLVENTFWHKNRFIRCGVGNDPPMVFMSGDHTIGYGQNDIFDKNIFIKGKGYALNGWHSYHNFVFTRNFVGDVWGGWIGDGRGSEHQGNVEGSDHLIANNIFWNSGEGQGQGFNAATLIASNTHFINNILVDRSNIAVSENAQFGWRTLENFVVNKNAFLNVPISFGGTNNFELTPGNELSQLGIEKTNVDQTIASINTVFSQTIAEIYANQEIEPLFELLETVSLPPSSPLYNAGDPWVPGSGTIHIGTDVSIPTLCGSYFKYAFEERGLRRWNREGTMVLQRPSFTFTDGSGTTNYRGYDPTNDPLDFKIVISPRSATYVRLSFESFETEAGGDVLRIYDGTNTSAALLGEFSGSALPGTVTSSSGSLLLHFITDNDSNTGGGWLASYTSDGVILNSDEKNEDPFVPSAYILYQNFPNPFNPSTTIQYSIAEPGFVTLTVYDILGQQTAVLVSEEQQPGFFRVVFDAADFAGGVYFYKLQCGTFTAVNKMVLLK